MIRLRRKAGNFTNLTHGEHGKWEGENAWREG
jgi:hypothetical protein